MTDHPDNRLRRYVRILRIHMCLHYPGSTVRNTERIGCGACCNNSTIVTHAHTHNTLHPVTVRPTFSPPFHKRSLRLNDLCSCHICAVHNRQAHARPYMHIIVRRHAPCACETTYSYPSTHTVRTASKDIFTFPSSNLCHVARAVVYVKHVI